MEIPQMNWNRLIRIILYIVLLLITLTEVIISVFHESLFLFEPTPYILGLGLLFLLIFTLIQSFLKTDIDFHNILTWTGECITKIQIKEMSNILYYSAIKTGLLVIIFGIINFILLILNLILFEYVSWGNIIFSSLLFWLIYGKFQIRHEITDSIYYGKSVKHIIKHNSIDLITDSLRYELNIKDLKFEYIDSNWVIFKRKKFNDYIILENR
jgi:hypothetical protein